MIKNIIRQRNYAHFDRTLSNKAVQNLVTNKDKVAKHAFWPLIVRPIKSVHRKKSSTGRREFKIKKRPVVYAAHSDSYIYSHYASYLSKYLEEQYAKYHLCNQAVLAYRAFEVPKNNIHFAFEIIFSYIKKQGSCEVITLDVEGFFDNLDHRTLKEAWLNLLPVEERSDCGKMLREDHYAVFKASTLCYGVKFSTLREVLGGEVRSKRGNSNATICDPFEFREKVVPQIKPLQILVNEIKENNAQTSLNIGIPQGLPISSVLSNIYMLETDKRLSTYASKIGGIYRRYSDDILLVIPVGKDGDAKQYVVDELKKLKLNIQSKKTKKILVSCNKALGEELNLTNPIEPTPFLTQLKCRMCSQPVVNRT